MAERNIVDVGKFLQQYGWNVGENPAFGSGRVGGHAPGSYHYGGQAIDITVPHGQDVAPAYPGGKPKDWKTRTGELSWRAKQLGLFQEALGPGDKGHETHVHLALPDKKPFTDQQLQWLATGRYTTPEGKLTDVMPSGALTAAPQQPPETANPNITYNIFYEQKKPKTDPREFLLKYLTDAQQQESPLSANYIYKTLTAAAQPSSALSSLGLS